MALAVAKKQYLDAQREEFGLQRKKEIFGSRNAPLPDPGSVALPSVEDLDREILANRVVHAIT